MREKENLFLSSELDEADFYSLPKENLLTLKEYLLMLKEKDNEFQLAIKPYFESIKEEYPWLSEITFGGLQGVDGKYLISTVYLYAKDGINLIMKFNPKSFEYEDIANKIPFLYLLSSKTRTHIKRIGVIKTMQDELYQIETIGQKIYDGVLYTKSISNNFTVHYDTYDGALISSDSDLVAKYLNHPRKYKEKEILSGEVKEEFLNRVLIRKR